MIFSEIKKHLNLLSYKCMYNIYFQIFRLKFRLIGPSLYDFENIWGWFILLNFFYEIEGITFFIPYYEETLPIDFVKKYCVVEQETIKLLLDTSILKGDLNSLKRFPQIKKISIS